MNNFTYLHISDVSHVIKIYHTIEMKSLNVLGTQRTKKESCVPLHAVTHYQITSQLEGISSKLVLHGVVGMLSNTFHQDQV